MIKKLVFLLLFGLLIVISCNAEYQIVLSWDMMAGELNGVLSGTIDGEYAYVQGIGQASALGGKIKSMGETSIPEASQSFVILSDRGFFSFWIRDKYADDDINPALDLIQKAKPRIDIYQNRQLLQSFSIDRGMGLTCKIFTLDAESGLIDQEIRFYPRTKVILTQIVNALDGSPIADAELSVTGGEEQFPILFSDEDGFAAFPAEIGSYQLSIRKPGFIGTVYPIRMGFDENPIEYVAALSPEVREYRIVLTWGARPLDLDAHLSGPKPEGGNFHIWYRNRILVGGRDFLDRDDMDGYGPETITIYKPASGTYSYNVHDYSNRLSSSSKALSRSGASVFVYAENRLLHTFTVPPEQAGNLWKVFTIDKNHRVNPISTITWINKETDIR